MAQSSSPWGHDEGSVARMWEHLNEEVLEHNTAVNGDAYFSLPSTSSKRVSTASRALAAASGPAAAQHSWSSPSSHVMNIDTPRDDSDPFDQSYAAWPLEGQYNVVYAVSLQLRHDDPPLFTQLVTAPERFEAYRKFKGQCLNCLGNHAFKSCPQDFMNQTGLLNPDVGPHGSWRRWKKRMTSDRL
ncbi:unnamed protein product, partial [Pylaiella littoralis]